MSVEADAVVTVPKVFTIKGSDTLVSGLLTINVKHTKAAGGVAPEHDCHLAYSEHWNATDNPNNVITTGNKPYYEDHTDYTHPPKYPDASTFNAQRQYLEANDPNDSSADNKTVLKDLSTGDSDCYLFYVTCSAHLESPKAYWVYPDPDPAVKLWHHNACQSFIKSHLISRINNGSDSSRNDGETDYTMWKRGHYRRTDTMSAAGVLMNEVTENPDYLFSNGNYDHQMHSGLVADSASPAFGFDLGDGTGNTFFPPVENIQIGIYHPAPNGIGLGHSTNSYGLDVRVHMWAIEGVHVADKSFYRDRVNILWQPFGEQAAFEDP